MSASQIQRQLEGLVVGKISKQKTQNMQNSHKPLILTTFDEVCGWVEDAHDDIQQLREDVNCCQDDQKLLQEELQYLRDHFRELYRMIQELSD